ncbi:MAG TPA: ABC transporter substrate-binding protein [Alphaproteobacteria bacterium]|nr:ABC transporter substrate-binding protein [Alphaproteobacteria bacterium]
MPDQAIQMTSADVVSRRAFLKALGIATGSALMSAQMPSSRARAANPTGPDFQLRAPEPNPKYGGTLRYGVLSAPAHFDVHQSGTVSNMGTQGAMYDNLIRRDPRDGQTIIPDLAHSWKISDDGKTYTFFLRQGVKFHDGADFTAEDVHATFHRIIWPPKGISIPRTPLFSAVSDIVIVDPYTIEFRLSEPRPQSFMLGAFASGWNIIVRKKTLEEHNYNLRDVMDYPGTGPFKHVRRIDKELWVMEKNPHYWNKGLPYVDRLEVYHLPPFSPELGAALLAGKLDYARLLDPVTARKVQDTPGMTATDFYQSVIQAVWVNTEKKPLHDPRIRRAMHLVFDRPVLVDVVKDVAPMMVGGFIYPFSEWATPTEELSKRLGYQKDPKAAIQEARRLMAEAGYPHGLKNLDFLVREAATFKLWAVAIQAMLKEALNIETNLRTVQISAWFDEAQAGNFDLAISAIVSTLMDPSDYFNAWYAKDGPQNYSKWSNDQFQALVRQIDRETDTTKRKALVRQAEEIMENDPPLLPVSYEKIYDGWYNYVKGHNPYHIFGIYDVVRWDTVWLDK